MRSFGFTVFVSAETSRLVVPVPVSLESFLKFRRMGNRIWER
jgi:hypothetical protein